MPSLETLTAAVTDASTLLEKTISVKDLVQFKLTSPTLKVEAAEKSAASLSETIQVINLAVSSRELCVSELNSLLSYPTGLLSAIKTTPAWVRLDASLNSLSLAARRKCLIDTDAAARKMLGIK